MTFQIRVPDPLTDLAERAEDDFELFAFEGFGIKLSSEQLEARIAIGRPGPRERAVDPRFYWLSGAQRAGKTILLFLLHAEANLYKIGLDRHDREYWEGYQYKTLNIAPSDELCTRLWAVGDEIQKNVSAAQWNPQRRSRRRGKFLHLMVATTEKRWPIFRFANKSWIDFRSSEGGAKRLEGTFWRFFTWDEWASQPDREIDRVLDDVLQGRARDTDAKIVPAAWPKAETERHLIAVERALETGIGRHAHDSKVIYMSAENAHFTNRRALAVERSTKDEATYRRTVLGRTGGGAAVEFKLDVIQNMVRPAMSQFQMREDGYGYLTTADLGLGHDSTVIGTWRIPRINGRLMITPQYRARLVHGQELKGSEDLTIDRVTFEIAREKQAYNSVTAVDATGMGGLAAVRQLKDLSPPPLAFKSSGNHRIYGNMRLAAITNGLDLVSWGRPSPEIEKMGRDAGLLPIPWGLIEIPRIPELVDQLANFDRDANDKGIPDDWVWMLLIAAWYMRRFWVVEGTIAHQVRSFDVRGKMPVRRLGRLDVAPTVDQGLRSGPVEIRPR